MCKCLMLPSAQHATVMPMCTMTFMEIFVSCSTMAIGVLQVLEMQSFPASSDAQMDFSLGVSGIASMTIKARMLVRLHRIMPEQCLRERRS